MSASTDPHASAGEAQADGGAPWLVSMLLLLAMVGTLMFLYAVAGPGHVPAPARSSAPTSATASRAPSGHAAGGLASPAPVDVDATDDEAGQLPAADEDDVPVDASSDLPEAR